MSGGRRGGSRHADGRLFAVDTHPTGRGIPWRDILPLTGTERRIHLVGEAESTKGRPEQCSVGMRLPSCIRGALLAPWLVDRMQPEAGTLHVQ